MNLVSIFIILQIILLFFMVLHDWIHLPPLTDIRALEKNSTKKGRIITSTIFALLIIFPLSLTWIYRFDFPFWVLISNFILYATLTMGTIFSWWIPYFFGSSEKHKKDFEEYKNTHHFLPPIGDNVIPNTFHVILHLQIWTCLVISLYLLIKYFI